MERCTGQHGSPRAFRALWVALALRGIKPFKMFLTTFVRNTTCLNEVMKIVKTQGLSTASMQACQERLRALPTRSPIRKEVSDYLEAVRKLISNKSSA